LLSLLSLVSELSSLLQAKMRMAVSNINFFIIKMSIFSNIRNISLTYLRGLEIAELKEEDMPMV